MGDVSWIRWLGEQDEADIDVLGGKGANLGRLLRLGLPVPPAFVVTTAAYRAFLAANDLEGLGATDPALLHARILQAPLPDDLRAALITAYQRLGGGPVAVRSSGTAEDLAAASFAGQHDTFLDVSGPEALLSAVRACWASLWAPRAVAYRRQQAWGDSAESGAPLPASPLALAVVVQVMVAAEAAGVAFTANPVTGERAETTISAVRGLGEQLVSGEGMAEEWIVRGEDASGEATRRRTSESGADTLTAEQALAVAGLARRIERHFGGPQDVEWAIDARGQLFVLQARPMTALPEPVAWISPAAGGWMRNFRLGEWLPEPVTPLCDTWLLARIEEGEVAAQGRDFGLRPRPPYHVLANGWYFSSPVGGGFPLRAVAGVLVRHPRRVAALALSTRRPDLAERALIAPVARRWRAEVLPHYQRLVATWEARTGTATPAELVHAIDEIARVAGEYLWCFSVAGGHAWKAEHALARFCREHLPQRAERGHQELLLGLPSPFPATPPHAVQSLDWIRPTLGETLPDSAAHQDLDLAARKARLEQERRAAEAACRDALADRPRLRRRFDAQLAFAQRYAVLREEQAGWFTLGWPFLRRAVLRLGDELRQRDAVERGEDVFFLTRAELEAGLDGRRQDMRAAVATRRREWERQRRLSPPLTLGKPLGARLIAQAADAMRAPGASTGEELTGASAADTLKGMPASPGRATGPVRIVRGPEDFGRFQPGEVLVAQVTAPAWTPLFGLAAAVVTDGGSLAAHASLVAREYGIPAVVGVGDATTRLRDGQQVTVDGSAGIVRVLS
ncbi:MAG TPA: PEP/pyruvate-binding domain-containing protein [Ktedonobacterales bacterium]|nr:PEP/pyruvate-binding domain-containing protein [Ktedonobacterales bacterium]